MSCCQKSILNLVSNQLRFWFTVLHTKEKRYPKKKWRTPSISSLIYWLAENSSFCALLHHADLAIFNWNNANKAQFDGSFSLSISAPLKLRKLWDVSGPKAHSHIDDDDKQYENDTSDLQQIMCRGVVFFFSSIFLSLSLTRSCSVSLGWFRSHLQQIIVLNKQNRVPHDKSSIDLNRITAHTVNWMCHITPGRKWSAENMLCTSLIYNKRAAWLGAQTFHCFQLTTTYYTRITWFYQMSMKIVSFQPENENPKNLVGNQTLYCFMEWS